MLAEYIAMRMRDYGCLRAFSAGPTRPGYDVRILYTPSQKVALGTFRFSREQFDILLQFLIKKKAMACASLKRSQL